MVIHGIFYYLLPVGLVCYLLACYRDYGYSTLCIYTALLLRRLANMLIREARKASDRQAENAQRIGRKLMELTTKGEL